MKARQQQTNLTGNSQPDRQRSTEMSTNTNLPNRTSGGLSSTVALFRDEARAERALQELKREGFSETEIGIATTGRGNAGQSSPFWDRVGRTLNRKVQPESTASVRETLQAAGMSEPQARYFDTGLARGDILVSVRASGDRALQARSILDRLGADLGATGISVVPPPVAEGLRDIQLIGEVLQVHKEKVQRGEVRLHKEVVSETKSVDVPVMHEEFVIERVRVDGRAAPHSGLGEDSREIRVPLIEEQVHVEKTPVVTEEIHFGKREVRETRHVSDTVRHEELRTDQKGSMSEGELRNLRDKLRNAA
jgi:uncharacterized protein (TIGR02271 family)